MHRQLFVVRSVSAALKNGGETGKAASLALVKIGFSPKEFQDSVCTSVPREGEHFLIMIEEQNSNRFLLYKENPNPKIKWDNPLTGFFTRTGGKKEVDGSRIFSGFNGQYDMISFVTDFDPIASSLHEVPVGSFLKKAVAAPVQIPKQAPAIAIPQSSLPVPQVPAPQKLSLSQEEIAAFSSAFINNRDPKCRDPYEVAKAVLHLHTGGCEKGKRISVLLKLSPVAVYQSLSLKDLPLDWIEKIRKGTPRTMKFTAKELVRLSKVTDKADREQRYSGLLAHKALRFGHTVSVKKVRARRPDDSPEVQEYAAQFVAQQNAEQKMPRNEFQAETIEAVLWCAKRGLNGSRIANLIKVSTPTTYKYLELQKLPEEWLTQLSLTTPEAERLLPRDAMKLAAIEDIEERKKRYDEILANRRQKLEAKTAKAATKRTYTRRTIGTAGTAPVVKRRSPKRLDLPLTRAEEVQKFREWLATGKAIISKIKARGDNTLEPPLQAELLECLRGLQKAIGNICEGSVFQRENPWPQHVLHAIQELGPMFLQGEALADAMTES